MATTLASQAAIAYENAVLTERLQRNAEELDRTGREQLAMKDQFHLARIARTAISAVSCPSIHYYPAGRTGGRA